MFTDWLSAWTASLLILLLLGFGALEIRQTRNQKSTAKEGQKPTDDHYQPIRQPHAAAQQKHPTEEEHRSAQQAYWLRHLETRNRIDWIGWVTLGFSALATIGVILSFRETRRQADISQKALVASERPWVMLTDVTPLNLGSDDHFGVSLWVKVSVKNIGHSPAQNVSISAKLLITDTDTPPNDAMVSVCQGPRNGLFIIPGHVLFPDQAQDLDGGAPHGFEVEADSVWAARTKRIKSVYDVGMTYGHAQKAEAWANQLAKFPFYAPLSFVGCINYRSSDNVDLYQTSFRFDVGTKPAASPFPLLSGVPPIIRYPEPVPGDPDTLMVFRSELQRFIPGNQVILSSRPDRIFAN